MRNGIIQKWLSYLPLIPQLLWLTCTEYETVSKFWESYVPKSLISFCCSGQAHRGNYAIRPQFNSTTLFRYSHNTLFFWRVEWKEILRSSHSLNILLSECQEMLRPCHFKPSTTTCRTKMNSLLCVFPWSPS